MKNDIYNGSSEGFNFLLDGYMDYSKEQFAVIHPSGAVGDRLLGKEK